MYLLFSTTNACRFSGDENNFNISDARIYIISTCYHVSQLQEYFICNLCNIFCFSGFTDQACEPVKIMFVITITIDFALGAN